MAATRSANAEATARNGFWLQSRVSGAGLFTLLILLLQAIFAQGVAARPHAGFSGLAAAADNAGTAGTNPAGITRFESSAFPSLAYRVNDKLSVAGSLALSYSVYDQERAVANIFDPGVADGTANLETDGFDTGFALSALYEMTDKTR